jgi:CelD/BcsL family acetyltransferase involved in cellulose biosynthesis
MNVECVTTRGRLAELAPDWNRLSRGVPFRSWQWLATWWSHYGECSDARRRSARLYTLAVFDHGELIALAPWYVQAFPLHGRVVHFLGSGQVCTEYQSVLCKPGWEAKVSAELADWLHARAGEGADDGWDQLELGSVNASDTMMPSLCENLAERGALAHCRPAQPCWRVDLPASWEEYTATLSKSHRKELRGCRRHYFDTGRAVLHTVTDGPTLAAGMGLLIDLHQRRRRSLGDTGCFASPRFTAFHREVTGRLLAQGQLRLHWLELDGQSVAAEYHLAGADGMIYAYQSGIEVSALAHSPGRLATMAILRAAIAAGFRGFDLLRGDEPYKAHWRARPRPMVEIRVFPGKAADHLRYGMRVAGDMMRDWIKSRETPAHVWLNPVATYPTFGPQPDSDPWTMVLK